MLRLVTAFFLLMIASLCQAQAKPKNLPSIPTGSSLGIKGSVGVGFTDFTILDPSAHFSLDRGTYTTAALERGFDVMNLYFTMALGHMTGSGRSNYTYRNLSTSNSYSTNDIAFNASMFDLSVGFKLKLIDKYWFGPYVEGGGMGSYHEITYTSKLDALDAQGNDAKKKDVVMGSGYYGEAGIDVQFSDKFGIKFAGRFAEERTKELETLNKSTISFRSETYYFSALIGF